MVERVTLKALRRKLIAWQETNAGSDAVPLEIQEAAKEIGKRHGYMALSRYLKVDFSKLFADVGMGRRSYKPRNGGSVLSGRRKKQNQQLEQNVTITALPIAPSAKQQISISVYFKNGLRCELEVTASEVSNLLSHLSGVAC